MELHIITEDTDAVSEMKPEIIDAIEALGFRVTHVRVYDKVN